MKRCIYTLPEHIPGHSGAFAESRGIPASLSNPHKEEPSVNGFWTLKVREQGLKFLHKQSLFPKSCI